MKIFSEHQDFKYAGKQNKLVASHAGNLFLLVRPGLFLVAPLAKLTQESSSPDIIKKLRYDGDCEVLEIGFSLNGKLLFVRGRHSLSVLIVPSILGKEISLTTLKVGELELGTDFENPLVKALWHPLGKYATHLTAISQNGVTRVYDLSANIKYPESKFSLFQQQSPRKGFHLASDLDIVSATFGFGDGWLPMTLFYLLRNGDLMALSPVLPRHGTISKLSLEKLITETEDILKNLVFQSALESDLENCRLDFLQDLLQSCLDTDSNYPDILHFTSPKMSNYEQVHDYSVSPQGPFRLIPTPSSSLDQSFEASDICFSTYSKSINGQQHRIPCLAIAYSHGLVDFCVVDTADESFGPVWDGPLTRNDLEERQSSPALWVLESVDLSLVENEADHDCEEVLPVLYRCSEFPGIFFVLHSSGLHYLDISLLMSGFMDSLVSPDSLAEFSKFIGQTSHIQIGGIFCTRQHQEHPPNSITSVAVWTEALITPFLIATTQNDELFFENVIILSSKKFPRKSLEREVKPSTIEYSEASSLLREVPITKDFPFIVRTNDSVEVGQIIPSSGKVVIKDATSNVKYPECISKTNLEILSKETAKIRDNIRQVQEYITLFEKRMELISKQDELTKADIESISNESINDDIERRLVAAKETQSILNRRMEICMNIAMELSAPSLSQAEMEWAEELSGHSKNLKDLKAKFTHAKGMVSVLVSQLQELEKDESLNIGNGTPMKQWSGTYQLKNISNIVEKEGDFLFDLKGKVKELMAKVDLLESQY